MEIVDATRLKNRLGEVLRLATLAPVAIERHGRIVAYLVPASNGKLRAGRRRSGPERGWTRREEDRAIELCASGDFRPSRWQRAGEPRTFAGLAAMLASEDGFDRARMLALAERLHPGMSTPEEFGAWLVGAPVQASRFLPLLRKRIEEARLLPRETRVR